MKEPARPLSEAIRELMEERPRSCDFYHSWEHDENLRKHKAITDRIFNKIGKALRKRIFKDYLEMEMLEGEFQAELQMSSYKLGFTDALLLMGEIERAKNGQNSIFR
ncbi:hypothetical protein Desaci_3026 [Desulfosporosinus acidiphilus SJ4]|uniref:Uncharacterized protein n=1 Tax=Desulfosporosinus acidiphilus (strain DSM 22704 / JCM 16185 / SJ4) TaxID=646529 RepID=I4D810_DESAJ|nr:hypothetical protein [Desulfosporosinus acidiphilus]AFM41934.1 hypothetical protein Desaci_3026 [Desulfosporosinus acidiphilus SJ4]